MRRDKAFFPSVVGLGCRSPKEAVQPVWFYLGRAGERFLSENTL